MGIPKYGLGPFFLDDQIFVDHLPMGTKFDGDRLSRGINFIGIICSGGQKVGDRKSVDQNGLGTKCIATGIGRWSIMDKIWST